MKNTINVSILSSSRKILVIVGAISGLFALLSFTSEFFSMYIDQIYNVSITRTALPLAAAVISVAAFALHYLQYGGKRDEEISTINEEELEGIKQSLRRLEKQDFISSTRMHEIIERLRNDIKKGKEEESILSPEEKNRVIKEFSESVYSESAKGFLINEAGELKEAISRDVKSRLIDDEISDTTIRLKKEIRDLRLRANANLALGIAITAGGLYLLWDTVALLDASENLKAAAQSNAESDGIFYKSFLLEFLPRLSLVLFVEIFAYFFLKLYKDGLSEIKYFQNELTNIDAKSLALSAASILPASDALNKIIEKLSETERNYILEKGQTTVELEKARSDGEVTKSVIKSLPELFKSKKR